MSDPAHITGLIENAQDAFEYIGQGRPDFEEGIDQDDDWKTQLTKACRYLESARVLRNQDGFNGAVIELSFGAIERSLEAYLLWNTNDSIKNYRDHEMVYDRVADRGLFDRDTASQLKDLYGRNRTEHYYGVYVPTQQKEEAMYALAENVHQYVSDQFRHHDTCICISTHR